MGCPLCLFIGACRAASFRRAERHFEAQREHRSNVCSSGIASIGKQCRILRMTHVRSLAPIGDPLESSWP